jgi:DNA-binding NarL/FixJ family response regulator
MKTRQWPPEQQARIEVLAKHFTMNAQELSALVIDAGLAVMERKLLENNKQPLPSISQQQRIVLDLLQQGKTVKEIAYQLNLGEATIRTHITRIKDKLNCNDLLHLRMNGLSTPAE